MTAHPIGWREAKAFVESRHRHHFSPQGWKWGVGAMKRDQLVGVVMVGRPVSREIQRKEPLTAEAIRLCTDGTRNACSFLYARARQSAFILGYTRIITYILEDEPGTSLVAAGWQFVRMTDDGLGFSDKRGDRIGVHIRRALHHFTLHRTLSRLRAQVCRPRRRARGGAVSEPKHPLQPGDRVVVYNSGTRATGEVCSIDDSGGDESVLVTMDKPRATRWFHPKQLRRLRPGKKREARTWVGEWMRITRPDGCRYKAFVPDTIEPDPDFSKLGEMRLQEVLPKRAGKGKP